MSQGDDYSYEDLTKRSTGSPLGDEGHKFVEVTHGRFEIRLCLTEDDRFLWVAEVRVKKDFRTIEQRIANTGYVDIEQYYQEQE